MDEIVKSGLVGIAGSVVTWFLMRKKQAAETKITEATAHTNELDATEKAVAIWRNLAQDLKKEVDELRILIGELRNENTKLKEEIETLRVELRNKA